MKASRSLTIANPPLDLRLVIALDVPLLVEPTRYDPGWNIAIPSAGEATLHMPSFAAGEGPSVTPPSGFERVSPDWIGTKGWGRFVHPERVAQIGALAFRVSIDAGDIESEIPGLLKPFRVANSSTKLSLVVYLGVIGSVGLASCYSINLSTSPTPGRASSVDLVNES